MEDWEESEKAARSSAEQRLMDPKNAFLEMADALDFEEDEAENSRAMGIDFEFHPVDRVIEVLRAWVDWGCRTSSIRLVSRVLCRDGEVRVLDYKADYCSGGRDTPPDGECEIKWRQPEIRATMRKGVVSIFEYDGLVAIPRFTFLRGRWTSKAGREVVELIKQGGRDEQRRR